MLISRQRIFLVLLALLGATACSFVGGDTEVRSVPVTSFNVVETTEQRVRFSITGEWRNTCGTFSHVDASREGTVYTVTLYGKQPEGALCGQAFTPFTGEWATTVPEPGTYTFQFDRRDRAPIDTTLTLPAG